MPMMLITQDVAERAGVAANGLGSLRADHADTKMPLPRSGEAKTDGGRDVASRLCWRLRCQGATAVA